MRSGDPRLLAAAVIVAACFASRWGTLELGPLNIDEAQYVAFASYLSQSGQSAFDVPILHVYTHAVYQLLATFADPFSLFGPRVLVLVLCALTGWLIYRLALRIMPWGLSLLAALLFVAASVFCEGLTANREWFCLPFGVGALLVFANADMRDATNSRWLIFAGVLAGAGFWFKEQAIVFVLPIALELGFRIVTSHERIASAKSFAWYGFGVIVGLLGGALPMLWHGTLEMQIEWLRKVELSYVAEGQARGGVLAALWEPLYLYSPWRRVGFVGGIVCAFAIWRRRRVQPRDESPREFHRAMVERCVAFYFLAGIIAVQAGSRFYSHYFLLPLPCVAILTVLGIWLLVQNQDRWDFGILSGFALVWFVADLLWAPALDATFSVGLPAGWQASRIAMVLIGLILGTATKFGWMRTGRVLTLLAASAILLDVLIGMVRSVEESRAVAMAAVATFESKRIGLALKDRGAKSEDTLFVWGWRPELYLGARLPAASRFATCLEVVAGQDESLVLEPRFDADYMDMLLADLDRYRPRFIVDASLCSFFGSMYNLEFVPPMSDYLRIKYRRVVAMDGCEIFERSEHSERESRSVVESDALESKLAMLDHLVKAYPHDMLHFELNRADLFAQSGRWCESRDHYVWLKSIYPSWNILPARIQKVDRIIEHLGRGCVVPTGAQP